MGEHQSSAQLEQRSGAITIAVSMNTLALLAFALLQVLVSASIGDDLEMAPYDVIKTTETYEERHYPARKWISTMSYSISDDDVGGDMFHKLFNYIDGQNEQGVKIAMTSPVTTFVVPGAGPNCESNFTMSFLIPEIHSEAPPAPTNPDVFVEERPELPSVFARRFKGFANEDDYIREAAALANDLNSAGEDGVNYDTWYMADYDGPYTIINRRNEVRFLRP